MGLPWASRLFLALAGRHNRSLSLAGQWGRSGEGSGVMLAGYGRGLDFVLFMTGGSASWSLKMLPKVLRFEKLPGLGVEAG